VLALVFLVASCGGGHAAGGSGGAGGGSGVGGAAGDASSGSAGAGGAAGGAPGSAGGAGVAGSAGSGGELPDAGGFVSTDAGFPADFATQGRTQLAAVAPSWTCDDTLPTVPVADSAAAHDAVRQYVAQVVGLAPADLDMSVQECDTATTITCSGKFAHDASKSGGPVYPTVMSLGDLLEANATSVEETFWIPTGTASAVAIVISGISDGQLVGMVIFEAAYPCH